jgi:hypothetical protein
VGSQVKLSGSTKETSESPGIESQRDGYGKYECRAFLVRQADLSDLLSGLTEGGIRGRPGGHPGRVSSAIGASECTSTSMGTEAIRGPANAPRIH